MFQYKRSIIKYKMTYGGFIMYDLISYASGAPLTSTSVVFPSALSVGVSLRWQVNFHGLLEFHLSNRFLVSSLISVFWKAQTRFFPGSLCHCFQSDLQFPAFLYGFLRMLYSANIRYS